MSIDDRDREWVRRQLSRLASVYDAKWRWQLFEPSSDLYMLLENGEDETLQAVVDRIVRHLHLPAAPTARYEWGLRMVPEAAGDIRIGCDAPGVSLIRVPFFHVGRPYAVGSILAHELSHQLNAVDGIWESGREENERLTDLSAIGAGLGKLVLNGMSAQACDIPGTAFRLGYLTGCGKIRFRC
jgi:hypothetical protein